MKKQVEFGLFFGLALVLAGLAYFVRVGGLFVSIGTDFVFLFVVPVLFLAWRYGKRGLAVGLAEHGFRLGNWKYGLKWAALLLVLALPIMYYGVGLPGFKEYYPLWNPIRYSWTNFVIFELVFGVAMLATEFFYRGFFLFGLSKYMDERVANLIHAFLYMLVHIGKPGLEVPYSFAAGYVFGYVDLRSKSILPSFLMHWISSIIFDVFVLLL